MIELTSKQIAEGWVAIPDDCMEMPAALAGLQAGEWAIGWKAGLAVRPANVAPNQMKWHLETSSRGRIVAYRILGQSPAAPQAEKAAPATDPNAAMLARDGIAQTFEQRVATLAGNGCIFGTPQVERSPLLIVAPISSTGFCRSWSE